MEQEKTGTQCSVMEPVEMMMIEMDAQYDVWAQSLDLVLIHECFGNWRMGILKEKLKVKKEMRGGAAG